MKKLLLIEDEAELRDSVVDIVRYYSFDCLAVGSGEEALAQVGDYRPDLILCDVMLPGIDGYGILLELQQQPELATIPFIFLTAKSTYADIRKGMDLGADDYLTKPFTAEQLMEAIRNRLERFDQIQTQANQQNEYFRDYLKMTLPHELRTPMSGIIGYLDLLTDAYDSFSPEQIRQMLERMNNAARRLSHVVENYILYAQLTTSHADPVMAQKIRDYSYCLGCADVISYQAEQKALEHRRGDDLELSVDDALLGILPESLQKLVAELIDNACKFSEPGQPIVVTGRCHGADEYSLTISDQGRGLTPEQLRQIGAHHQFDRHRFEQQGLGLGLAICQKTVELLGGTLTLASTIDQGTTVSLTLPILVAIPHMPEHAFAMLD